MKVEMLLEDLGLTKNEAKVYVSLLGLGWTTTTAVIKDTGINTSKVYESLERLLKKGLVSYSVIRKKKHWNAESPKKIYEFLDDEKRKLDKKKQEANALIPELLLKQKSKKADAEYTIYEGIKGIKTARERVLEILDEGDTFYVTLSSYPKQKTLEAYWIDFHKRRAKKGIKCKYIFNESYRQLGKKREKISLVEARYVDPEVLSPAWTEIYKDYVSIVVLTEKPSILVIKNENVAKAFLNHFNFLWNIGKR